MLLNSNLIACAVDLLVRLLMEINESTAEKLNLKHLQMPLMLIGFEDDPDNLRRISIGRSGNMGTRASRSDIVIITSLLVRNPAVTTFTLSGIHVNHEAEGIVQLIRRGRCNSEI